MRGKITFISIIVGGLVSINAYFLIVEARVRTAPAEPISDNTQAFILPQNQTDYLPKLDISAGDIELDAKSAIVYDVKADRNLFQKNIAQKLPVASLTKILNAVVVWENLSPNDIVTVNASSVRVDGERQNLYAGETISV